MTLSSEQSLDKLSSIDPNVKSLFMQFPAMVCLLEGPELRCTFSNPFYSRLYGNRDLIGKTPIEMVPELEGQGHFEMLENVYRTGVPFYGYNDPVSADWLNDGQPSVKYFNFVYFPYIVAEEIIGVIAFGLEVTDYVLAKKVADNHQVLINTISKAAPTCLWICDHNMECIFVNETWIQWTGKPLAYHLGTGWANNIIEEDREAAFSFFQKSYKAKINYTQEYRIICSDGSTKWCLSSGSPWYLPDGTFGGFAGSSMDISERKQEEKRIQTMVDALPLMAWTAKPNGEIDYLNQRWYDYTGQTPEEAFGTGWASAMPPDTEKGIVDKWFYSVQHKVPYEAEVLYRRLDSTYRWHIARAEPIKHENGDVLYWLGTSTDIHDQKTLSALLEQKVKERTSELLNTNIALKRSNEDLEQFASVASHDLKEPLRKIQFFTDTLQDNRTKNPETAIRKIKEASNRMMNLIEDLLEFSTLRRAQEQFQQVDLNQVLEAVQQDLELIIKEKEVVLEAEPLPTIKGIPYQLEQLFNNLIGNAIKYSKTSEACKIAITINKTSAEDLDHLTTSYLKGSYITIKFTDNGIGFQPEDAERIFGIFERLHSKDTYTGTGVGLALCRKVVHNHGGEIYATSQPGVGSSFVVILPV